MVGSPASPVTFPESPEVQESSLEFLEKMEISHEILQPIQSQRGNLQSALDYPKTQESYEAIMEAQRRKEEIKMIPTPIAWTIRKTLTKSDLAVLLLSLKPVAEHLLSHLSDIPKNRAEIIINLHDSDSDSTHKVSIGYGRGGYDRLRGFWKENFVQRRGLKQGNQIGLAWNPSTSTFVFGVISGAGSTCPVDKYIIPQQS